MMRTLLKRLLISLVLIFALVAPVAPVSAAGTDPFGNACSISGAGSSTACQTSTDNVLSGEHSVFRKVTNIIALVAGVAAVIVVIGAGIQFISSAGEGEKVAKAKRTITFAIVGLVVIVAGRALIAFILNRI